MVGPLAFQKDNHSDARKVAQMVTMMATERVDLMVVLLADQKAGY